MWLATLLITVAFSKNVLVVGDSHMAGPFGPELHKRLTKKNDVVTLGHASSAAIHWMDQFRDQNNQVMADKLSGGIFNQATIAGKLDQHEPGYNPSAEGTWRNKVLYPHFLPLMQNMLYHDSWKKSVGEVLVPDVVIIELGANDVKAIAKDDGTLIHKTSGNIAFNYEDRKASITGMLAGIKAIGAECIWVAPPDGKNKLPGQTKAIYDLLDETAARQCRFFDSRKYKATVCPDGVHFSCGTDMAKAREWAAEVADFTGL